jgi:hypothetical protein
MQSGQTGNPKSNRISPETPFAGQLMRPDEGFNPQANVRTDEWKVRGKAVSLRIQVDVIEKLQEHLFFGLKMSPPCDIRGVLVGRIIKESDAKIIVDGYELSRYTPKSDEPPLTRDDRLALDVLHHRRARDGARCVVGIFRSQARGWLALNDEDLRGADHLFGRAENIFLIVGPSQHLDNTAVVFFRRAGQRHVEKGCAQFPFNANLLRSGAASQMTWRDDRAEPCTAKIENPTSLRRFPRISFRSTRRSAGTTLLCWARGIGAGVQTAKRVATQILSRAIVTGRTASARRSWLPLGATWGVAVLATMFSMNGREMMNRYRLDETEAPLNASAKTLNLRLELEGELLEITWDPNATKLEGKKATITITDKSSAKAVQIDQTQIRAGRIYYRPPTGDLGVRMEVVAADGQTVSESVQMVSTVSAQSS